MSGEFSDAHMGEAAGSPEAGPRLLSSILGTLPVGLMVFDAETRLCYWNDWLERFLRPAAPLRVGISFLELFPELSQKHPERCMLASLRQGLPHFLSHTLHPTPFPLHRRTGIAATDSRERILQATYIQPIPAEDGPGRSCLIQIHDVSSIVEREGKLRSEAVSARTAADLYRAIVEDQTELIYRALPDGMITFANNAYCRYVGMERAELIGSTFRLGVLEEDRAATEARLAGLGPENPVVVLEHRSRLLDGGVRDLHWTYRALLDKENSVYEIQAVGRDITEQRESQELLERARIAAEAANQAKSEFLANMSHDIRTPLNAILGFATILLKSDMPDDQREQLEIIRGAGDTLLNLLNDILDFSRIEAGRLRIQDVEFSPRRVMRQSIDPWRLAAAEKGLELNGTVTESVPGILRGDALRLKQLLFNLLSNSIKYTESGSVELLVERAAEEPLPDDRLSIDFIVRDTGIGIPLGKQEYVFESFGQAEASRTGGSSGTGLGLAIVSRLAGLMGGEVRLKSPRSDSAGGAHGPGTEMCLRLPFFIGRLRGESEQSDPEDEGIEPEEESRPLRVLVVEDNEVNQRLMQRILGHAGHEVHLVGNGKEAVVLLDTNDYDAIFMDIQMPIMNGYEATRAIRARTGRPRVPIIALTANAYPRDIEEAYRSGMDECLTKPVEPALILRALNRWT